MAKVIARKIDETTTAPKRVEIKHTRVMQDASGNDVEILQNVEIKLVDDAISQCEAQKANLEAQLTECEAELADYIAIRDAE